MRKLSEKNDTLMFLGLAVAVVVVGGLMLLWGQHNSAEQIFEIGFLNYQSQDLLAYDEDYTFTEEEAALYAEQLAAGEALAGGTEHSYTAVTAAEVYGGFAGRELGYVSYDNGGEITVILLHGYCETARDAAITAPWWAERGYNIIIPSLRGSAGGELSTFGVFEHLDLCDLILDAGLEDRPLILSGRGSGAATALMLASQFGDRFNILGIVSDSVYSDLDTLKREQIKAQFGLNENFVGRMLTGIVKKQVGFDLTTISFTACAAGSTAPKLFICAGEDTFIGPEHTERVYEAAAGEKELLIVEGARHRMTWGEEYAEALERFLERIEG